MMFRQKYNILEGQAKNERLRRCLKVCPLQVDFLLKLELNNFIH